MNQDTSSAPALAGNNNSPLPFNLAAIALLLMILGLGAAYVLAALVRGKDVMAQSTFEPPFIGQAIGATSLVIPKSWYHSPAPRSGEFADRIDLRINLRLAPGAPLVPLDLRITSTSRVQPSSYLLDAVYLRRFSSTQAEGPVGLVGKPLRSADGFQNETVWYDPLSVRPFVAKCIDAVAPGQSAACLRTVHLPGQLAVTYRFDAALLPYWRSFDQTLKPWLVRIGAQAGQ